jgi:hypothetical protein
MYKRPVRIDPVCEKNTMDYVERGEKCHEEESTGLQNHGDRYFRISKSFVVNCMMYAIIFMVFFAGFTEISMNREKRHMEKSMARRLEEKRPVLKDCIRSESKNATEHIMCYANQARVFIVSDSEQDREILEEGKFHDVSMYFMNIHELLPSNYDIIDFLKTFDVQAPWVFVDGAFIGNKRDMLELHDFEVLQTGVKDAVIPPHLNEDEIRFLHSNNNHPRKINDHELKELGINPNRVRKHLRDQYLHPDQNKHQQYLKQQLDLLLNHQKNLDHIDMIQKDAQH